MAANASPSEQDSFGPSAYRDSVDMVVPTHENDQLLRIAFGSCYGLWDFQSNIFESIVLDEPDVWVWLGDAAYVDDQDLISVIFHPTKGATSEYVEQRLNMTKEQAAGYQELLQKTHVIGVWDDHDYGHNDAGSDFQMKD